VWQVWLDFKKLTQTLEDWYEDRVLYHLVGYLVATALPDKTTDGRPREPEARVIFELLKARQDATGTAFERHLRRLIWKRFMGPRTAEPPTDGFARDDLRQRVADRLDSIQYPSDSIAPALLLFNVASLLEHEASAQRFQFDAYKNNAWDIEHVRSVAEYIPGAPAERRRWLGHARGFAASPVAAGRNREEAEQLRDDIDALLGGASFEAEAFANVFSRVRALSGEAEAREDDNMLSNLALLDSGTNRTYRNAVFPAKRAWIISLDKRGQFVPPATRNIFLKYYTADAAQLFLWDGADQLAYGQALEKTLLAFFEPLVRKEGVDERRES
jgi:hypothetical protein